MIIDWSDHPNAKHISDLLAHISKHESNWKQEVQKLDKEWFNDWDDKTDRWLIYGHPDDTSIHLLNNKWNETIREHWPITAYVSDIERNLDSIYYTSILALFACDNCGHLLESTPSEVKLLAKLGIMAALLMEPAVIILNQIKENYDTGI